MSTSPDKKSAFGLSAEQIGRLLSIGSGDDMADAPCEDKGAGEHASSPAPVEEAFGKSQPSPQIEGYEIIEKVAEAGQGQVWRALQLSTGRDVAIKVPRVGSVTSERARLRFEREIELAARLNHANIARIYDSGIDRGQYYYVMDFIKGINLDEYVRQRKLSHREILELMQTICQAVQHAHQNGVIHRDLKPSNIIVAEDGRPYIVDFGLAKALSAEEPGLSVSMDGETVGTPAYMSPEQAAGRTDRLDTRTDVYSLGVILFHLLTGQSPHDLTGSRQEVLQRIAQGQVTRPRQVCPAIDRELEWLLLKTLDQDPDSRYAYAGALAEDIGNYLDGAPLTAGPPSATYRIKKFVKRNRTLVAAILMVGLTVGVGTVTSLTMYVRAKVQSEQSRAVSGFLTDNVLSALSPVRPQGGEMTALSVLNAISASIEGRFQNAPLVEASVRHELGVNYLAHGESALAVPQLEVALNIRRKVLGEDDPLTSASMGQLGAAYYAQGRLVEAHPLLLQVVAKQRQHPGVENDSRLAAMRVLGWNYEAMEVYDQAIRLYEECLTIARSTVGDTHVSTGYVMYSIGCWNLGQNRYPEAQKWFERALQLARQNYGKDHAISAEFTSYLGLTHLLQGHFSQAEPLLKESEDVFSHVRSNTDGLTLQSVGRLVCLYRNWGQLDEARSWAQKLEATKLPYLRGLSSGVRHDPGTDTYVMQGCGFDIWDLFDDFHFAHKTLNGDGSITVRIDSLEKVHTWTKVGVMMRATLEPTSAHASVFITPYGVVSSNHRRTECGMTQIWSGVAKPVAFPHWLRLTRRANTFTAEHSSNGVHWEKVHAGDPNRARPMEILVDETVHVGLALISHDVRRIAEARLSNVVLTGSVVPEGPFLVSADVGAGTISPSFEGSRQVASSAPTDRGRPDDSNGARTRFTAPEPRDAAVETLISQYGHSLGSIKYEESSDTYTVVGCGKDIWQTSDEFHFAYKTLEGGGSITARIEYIQPTDLWAKTGVMMRNSLTSDSAHASIFITPARRVCLQYRTAPGQSVLSIHTDPNAVILPHWVKLIREGNTFKAQHSDDGRMWKDLQGSDSLTPGAKTWPAVAEVPMNEGVYVGLAVTSHAGPLPAEAKMSHVSVTGKVDPPGEFLWSEDIGFQMIMLPKK